MVRHTSMHISTRSIALGLWRLDRRSELVRPQALTAKLIFWHAWLSKKERSSESYQLGALTQLQQRFRTLESDTLQHRM